MADTEIDHLFYILFPVKSQPDVGTTLELKFRTGTIRPGEEVHTDPIPVGIVVDTFVIRL